MIGSIFRWVWLILLGSMFFCTGCGFFAAPIDRTAEIQDNKTQPLQSPASNNGSQGNRAQVRPTGIPVLMYHSIAAEKNNDAVISPERFKEHMEYLYKNQYHPITVEELYGYLAEGKKLPTKPVMLTFDDGYRDTYEIALPVLRQYGFPSLMFIPAEDAGKRLSWKELAEMKAGGMEVSSHSYRHRDLGPLSLNDQVQEISQSKSVLDDKLKQNCRTFCYPNGSYTPDTIAILKSKGFMMAFTIEPGWVKPGDDLFRIKRVWMGNSVDTKYLEERLNREDYSVL